MSLNHYNDIPSLRSSRNPYSSAHFLPGLKSNKRHAILPSSGQKLSSARQSRNEVTPAISNESSNGIPSKRLLGSVWATVRNLDLLSTVPVVETSKDILRTTNRSSYASKLSLTQQGHTHKSTCAVQGISSIDAADLPECQPVEVHENISSIGGTTSSISSHPKDIPPQQQDSVRHIQDTPRPSSRSQTRTVSSLSNATSLVSTAGYNADTEVRYSSTHPRTSEESFEEYRQYINKSTTPRAIKDNPPKNPPRSVLSINSLYHEFVRDLADPVIELDELSQSTPRTLVGDSNSVTWSGSSAIKHDLITVPDFTIDPSDLLLPTQAEYSKEQHSLPSFSARVRAYQTKGDATYKAIPEPTFTEDWIFHLDDRVHTYKQYVPYDFAILKGGSSVSPYDSRNLQCRPLTPPSTPDAAPNIDASPILGPSTEENASSLRRVSSGLLQGNSFSTSFVDNSGQSSASMATAKQSLPILTISPPKSPEIPVTPIANTNTTREHYRSKRRQTYSLSSIPELAILSLAFCKLSETPETDSPYTNEPDAEDLLPLTEPIQQQSPTTPTDHAESMESSQIERRAQFQTTSPSPGQLTSNQKEQLSQTNSPTTNDLQPKPSIFPELDLASSLDHDVNLSLADFVPQRSPSAPPQLNSPSLRHTKWPHSTISEPQQAVHPSQRNSTSSPTSTTEHTPGNTSSTTPISEETSTLSIPSHLKALLSDSCPFPAPIQRSRLIPRHTNAAPWLKTRMPSTDLERSSKPAETTPCQAQSQSRTKDQAHNRAQSPIQTHSRTGTEIGTRKINGSNGSNGSRKSNIETSTTAAATASLNPLTGNLSTTHSWTEVWAGHGDPYEHLAPGTQDKRHRDRECGDPSTGWKCRQRQRVKGMLRGVLRRV